MPPIQQPPYLRIAAALQRRMADGELRPGDRLPSTRQLAREWKVAMATATKALTTLRHAGWIVAHARSGTVVATKTSAARIRRPSSVDTDQQLTRECVVQAAIGIADREGLHAMSMRGVAAKLGVASMSPYRFVDSKDALILLMTDAAFAEFKPPARSKSNWREQLTRSARVLWALYNKHPWLANVHALTRPLLLPHLMAHAEAMLAVLAACRLDAATTMRLHILLYSYVHGLAIHIERETQAAASTGLSEEAWMDTQAEAFAQLVASSRYPAFARVIGHFEDGYDLRLDELFESGLATLLDGFAKTIEAV